MLLRRFVILACILIIAYLGVCGAMVMNQNALIYPVPPDARSAIPPSMGNQIEIETPDGEKLFAIYSAPEDKMPTVIYFHGNGMQVAWEEPRARKFVGSGFGILFVEYRGYPGSTGKPSERGLYVDALAAYDWLSAQNRSSIVVNAHSLGTGVATYLASQRPVAAVALESPFDSLVAVAARAYPALPVGTFMSDRFASAERVQGLNAPLLIIHGDDDNVVPIEHGLELFGVASDPKEFVTIAGAGHNDLAQSGSTERVIEFFQSALGLNPVIEETR